MFHPDIEYPLYVSGVSAFLAFIIFLVQRRQGKKIKELVNVVHDATEERNQLLSDKRQVLADEILQWWLNFDFSYKNTIDTFDKFIVREEEPNEKESTRINIIEHYNNHLHSWKPKISAMEIVEVFGKKYFQPWSHLTSKASMEAILWQPYTDPGLKLLITHYQKCYSYLVIVKDLMLDYCSDNMREEIKQRVEENSKNNSSQDDTTQDSENE